MRLHHILTVQMYASFGIRLASDSLRVEPLSPIIFKSSSVTPPVISIYWEMDGVWLMPGLTLQCFTWHLMLSPKLNY